MKSILLFLFLLTTVVGKAAPSATSGQKPASLEPSRLVGKWHRGDGMGYNVIITLEKDSTYSAIWTGCTGIYGTAHGNWEIVGYVLKFKPTAEEEMMRKHLRELDIEPLGDGLILVPPNVREMFKEHGAKAQLWCFKPIKVE